MHSKLQYINFPVKRIIKPIFLIVTCSIKEEAIVTNDEKFFEHKNKTSKAQINI